MGQGRTWKSEYLAMKVGDTIVLEQSPDDKNWWGGHVRGGSRGHFPKAFVQRMEPAPHPHPHPHPHPQPQPQTQPQPLLHAHAEPAKLSMEDLRRELEQVKVRLAQSQADNAAKDKELDELRARLKQTQCVLTGPDGFK